MAEVRFQADADLKQAIVTGAVRRKPDLNFQSANEAGLEGVKDSEVLALAAREGRILVMHDRKTMPIEFGQFILSQALSIREASDLIILVYEVSTTEDWMNQIMTLPL